MFHQSSRWACHRCGWHFQSSHWVYLRSSLLLLDFIKTYLSFQIVLFIFKDNRAGKLSSESAQEHSRILVLATADVNLVSIGKFISPKTFVNQRDRIESSMCREIIASIVSIWVFWPHCQKVADWRVVWDLFTVYLGTVGVGTLQSLSKDGVQLYRARFTGFMNMHI